MSHQAVSWALQQPVKPSPAKFILVVLAHHVRADDAPPWRAFSSINSLVEATGQNRKTIMANIERLLRDGWLVDTGERTGATKLVPIYELQVGRDSTKTGTDKRYQIYQETVPELEPLNGTENNTITPLNGTETGTDFPVETVPDLPSNGTEFTSKRYQICHETVPDSVPHKGYKKEKQKDIKDKTSRTRTSTRAKSPAADPDELLALDLPPWLPQETWADWVEHRISIKAPMTARAASLAIRHLDRLRQAGNDPVAVVEQSVRSGKWSDLYPVKDQRQTQGAPMRMSRQEQAEAEHQRFLELTGGAPGGSSTFEAGGF